MPKHGLSEFDSGREISDDSITEECKDQGPSEYERQRLSRIAKNKARLKSLGLPTMVSSLMGQVKNVKNKNVIAKKKVHNDDDEDYRPDEAKERTNSSSEEGKDDSEDEGCVGGKHSRSRMRKKRDAKGSKQKSVGKYSSNSDYIIINDDDAAALRQAIALSLQDAGTCSFASDMHVEDTSPPKRKEKVSLQEGKGRRQSKKSFSSRLQMTEDELILHFFQFDEAGKGGITTRDLQRMARDHDFVWTDEELATMISCFDGDGDGKLNLEDFQNIAARCNLISQGR